MLSKTVDAKPPFYVVGGETRVTRDASEYRRDGWWRDQIFLDDLRRNAKERPDKPALITYRSQDDTQPRIVDYAELTRVTDSFAAALDDDGVLARHPSVREVAMLRTATGKVRKAELRERFSGI